MRLLLDTHAMYWYIEGSSELSATAEMLIQEASNDIIAKQVDDIFILYTCWRNR